MNKKERVICEFEVDIKKSFCWSFRRPGLKMDMDFRGEVWKEFFFCLKEG